MRVFQSSIIRKIMTDEVLNALIADFKRYKLTGSVPDHFGRDVPYDHPINLPIVLSEKVQHIHLGSEDKPLPLRKMQFHRTSDFSLGILPRFIG